MVLEAELDPPTVGESALEPLWTKELVVGLHAGQQYTECANIYNPIHTEPSVAKAAGLPDIILHGSATKAMALMAVVDECLSGNADRVTRLTGQLRGMVLMDTKVKVECLAEEVVEGEVRIAFGYSTIKGNLPSVMESSVPWSSLKPKTSLVCLRV